MGVVEPLSILIGIVGIAFIFYAFSVIKVFGRNVRWMSITMLVLLGVMLSDRLFSGDLWDLPWPSPLRDVFGPRITAVQPIVPTVLELSRPLVNQLAKTNGAPRPTQLNSGWQEVPSTVFTLLLPMIGEWKIPSESASPIPPAPIPSQATPSPSPTNPSPAPVQPSPAPSQIPSPAPSPSPSLAPATPTVPPPIPAWW